MPDLPTDLGGYQQILHGYLEKNDIAKRDFATWFINDWDIGHSIEKVSPGTRIYRKMPCPSQSDAHDQAILANQVPVAHVSGKAKTDDAGKPPLAYLPWAGINEVALVQAYGHQKYHDYNNYRKGMEVGRNLGCAIRHIAKYMEGQELDDESGRSHLAHAACRILFVLQNQHDGVAIDDRYKK